MIVCVKTTEAIAALIAFLCVVESLKRCLSEGKRYILNRPVKAQMLQ